MFFGEPLADCFRPNATKAIPSIAALWYYYYYYYYNQQ